MYLMLHATVTTAIKYFSNLLLQPPGDVSPNQQQKPRAYMDRGARGWDRGKHVLKAELDKNLDFWRGEGTHNLSCHSQMGGSFLRNRLFNVDLL